MADATSGDPSASTANGKVEGLPYSSDSDSGGVADAQTLSDCEQTLADSDQTLSESDQTSSDGDQTSADEDQLAADRDQAASDRDLAHGADPRAHELTQDVRERTTRQREHTARERDASARLRLHAAERRDVIADSRDVAGQRRDDDAAARTVALAELEAALEQEDDARGRNGADAIVRAAGQRRRAAERRAKAAAYRDLAAQDRRAAAHDREQAAQERLDALADRKALADELQREQERREEALCHQRHAEKLARTLQRSLSPPRLPLITGLDVAVHYEPFAPEDVGGDFYDLFPLGGGRVGFFLGDVCGKGPDAASVTSLARYTMRTAAMLHESPAEILRDLNSALLMESRELTCCTAVYGQVDLSGEAAAIILAVGGHPAPLVVRADGTVETTSAKGTMLGAVADPAFQTCEVQLAQGDAIVIYSDGILDTKIDGARVDEASVRNLLAGPPQAIARDLITRLLGGARRTDAPLHDDVAFMALRRSPVS